MDDEELQMNAGEDGLEVGDRLEDEDGVPGGTLAEGEEDELQM